MEKQPNIEYDKKPSFIKTVIFDVIFIGFCAFCAFYHFPYFVYTTGGSINLNERISSNNDYPTSGSYSMNYVSVMKSNLPILVMAFFRSDWDIVKEEEITYDNTSYEETLAIEKLQLQNSLDLAKIVAFDRAGKPLEVSDIHSQVIYIDEKADSNFKLLDEILTIDGNDYTNIDDLRAYINTFPEGHKFIFAVIDSDGQKQERYAKSYKHEDSLIVGISAIDSAEYTSEEDLKIETKASEAGPSGGLLLTLAIYDTLMEEDLTKGRSIMGTGTIDADGNVGEIGGVKYKMLGADKDDADIFFVPEGNYKEAKEVYEKYDLKFDLKMVKTIDEAIAYLNVSE